MVEHRRRRRSRARCVKRSTSSSRVISSRGVVEAPAQQREVVDAPPRAGSRRRGTPPPRPRRGAWRGASCPGPRIIDRCRVTRVRARRWPRSSRRWRGVDGSRSSPRITCVMRVVEVVDGVRELVGRRCRRRARARGRRAGGAPSAPRRARGPRSPSRPRSGARKRIAGRRPCGLVARRPARASGSRSARVRAGGVVGLARRGRARPRPPRACGSQRYALPVGEQALDDLAVAARSRSLWR